ncbi:MAG: TraR/DksA C4-type zinc finger protein [Patescibacteria group bacterium]
MKNVQKTTRIPTNPACELSQEDLEDIFKGAQIKLKESLNITQNIKESIKDGADDGRSYHTDPGDNSQIENLAPLLSRSGNNNTKMLLLQNVIIRILEGTFSGKCADCQETIGAARLKAIPETGFCIKCQKKKGG